MMGVAEIAVLSLFVGLPGIIFMFIYAIMNKRTELKKMTEQRRILELELEIEKQNNQIKLLEEENKKLDKIIYEG